MVVWTDKAKHSLKNIYYYIKEDSSFYAEEVKRKFIFESKKLSAFPYLGRVVPEIDNVNIRELFIYSYRMIYEVINNEIYILTIIHSKQNFLGN